MNTFIGVDLGWYGKPSGLASLTLDGSALDGFELRLRRVARLEETSEIIKWILAETGSGSAVVAVDAPLVIRNQTGIRPVERDVNRDFRRYHAGCHAANLGRPFASKVVTFSWLLQELGFQHGTAMQPREEGRFQIEVHPHAATINLFGLDRIVKYKRGTRDARAKELRRLRRLMLASLPRMHPALSPALPHVPKIGNTKPVEDQIDAVLCAFIAANWWCWTTEHNQLYGCAETGYIVVPRSTEALRESTPQASAP